MSNYAKNDQAASKAARDAMDTGSNWLKLKEGTTLLRILPPHVNMKDPETGAHRFYHPVCLHFGVGPMGRVTTCPRKMLGQQCVVCKMGFDLRNKGNEKAGNELLPSWQSYMNVLVYDADGDVVSDKEGDPIVYVWAASRGVLDQIFDEIEERENETKTSFLDITDPENGVIIKITKKGTGKENTKYRVKLAGGTHDITDIEDKWADELKDLTVLSPVLTAEQIKVIVEGSADDPFAKKALTEGTAPDAEAPDNDVVEGEFKEVEEDEDAAETLKRMMAKAKAKKGSKA